eukprot:2574225-Lingulodinium_polyedra.AAC.1
MGCPGPRPFRWAAFSRSGSVAASVARLSVFSYPVGRRRQVQHYNLVLLAIHPRSPGRFPQG